MGALLRHCYSFTVVLSLFSSDRSPQPTSSPSSAGDILVRQPRTCLVRAARQQDLVNLAEVLASSFHPRQGVTGWAYPLLRVGIYKDLRSHLNTRSQHQVYLVAVQQTSHENLVGTVELSRRAAGFWQPDRPTALYLSNLAVLSDYRRQGIAQQLLAACEQIALDWGFQELYLHVLENNHSARQLYRKAGYRVQSAELSLLQWLMRQPRQLLLSKRLSA